MPKKTKKEREEKQKKVDSKKVMPKSPEGFCCPFCQHESKTITVSSSLEVHQGNCNRRFCDREIQIYFYDLDARAHFKHIRSLYCVICIKMPNKQRRYFNNYSDIAHHLQRAHKRFFCKPCFERDIIIDDPELFTQHGLRKHYKFGTKKKTQFSGN